MLFHGYTSQEINYELYENQVCELGEIVKSKLAKDLEDTKKKYHLKLENSKR